MAAEQSQEKNITQLLLANKPSPFFLTIKSLLTRISNQLKLYNPDYFKLNLNFYHENLDIFDWMKRSNIPSSIWPTLKTSVGIIGRGVLDPKVQGYFQKRNNLCLLLKTWENQLEDMQLLTAILNNVEIQDVALKTFLKIKTPKENNENLSSQESDRILAVEFEQETEMFSLEIQEFFRKIKDNNGLKKTLRDVKDGATLTEQITILKEKIGNAKTLLDIFNTKKMSTSFESSKKFSKNNSEEYNYEETVLAELRLSIDEASAWFEELESLKSEEIHFIFDRMDRYGSFGAYYQNQQRADGSKEREKEKVLAELSAIEALFKKNPALNPENLQQFGLIKDFSEEEYPSILELSCMPEHFRNLIKDKLNKKEYQDLVQLVTKLMEIIRNIETEGIYDDTVLYENAKPQVLDLQYLSVAEYFLNCLYNIMESYKPLNTKDSPQAPSMLQYELKRLIADVQEKIKPFSKNDPLLIQTDLEFLNNSVRSIMGYNGWYLMQVMSHVNVNFLKGILLINLHKIVETKSLQTHKITAEERGLIQTSLGEAMRLLLPENRLREVHQALLNDNTPLFEVLIGPSFSFKDESEAYNHQYNQLHLQMASNRFKQRIIKRQIDALNAQNYSAIGQAIEEELLLERGVFLEEITKQGNVLEFCEEKIDLENESVKSATSKIKHFRDVIAECHLEIHEKTNSWELIQSLEQKMLVLNEEATQISEKMKQLRERFEKIEKLYNGLKEILTSLSVQKNLPLEYQKHIAFIEDNLLNYPIEKTDAESLRIAYKRGQVKAVKMLLERGSDFLEPDREGKSVLHWVLEDLRNPSIPEGQMKGAKKNEVKGGRSFIRDKIKVPSKSSAEEIYALPIERKPATSVVLKYIKRSIKDLWKNRIQPLMETETSGLDEIMQSVLAYFRRLEKNLRLNEFLKIITGKIFNLENRIEESIRILRCIQKANEHGFFSGEDIFAMVDEIVKISENANKGILGSHLHGAVSPIAERVQQELEANKESYKVRRLKFFEETVAKEKLANVERKQSEQDEAIRFLYQCVTKNQDFKGSQSCPPTFFYESLQAMKRKSHDESLFSKKDNPIIGSSFSSDFFSSKITVLEQDSKSAVVKRNHSDEYQEDRNGHQPIT